ncbi:hypothetical protein [Salinibacterium sp. ZJ454]|uniref:hypothetical protein n=1 Tax=Salinibacterium sp. ZJ454 TaxID=2708339 RepID=UPI0014244E5D|nr:hypothetical protein [Salinibacterium sp. ZJ454]
MKVSGAALVSILGAIVLVSGGVTLFQSGLYADATGTSGWNPWLWAIFFAGLVLTVFGVIHLVGALLTRFDRNVQGN